MIQTQPRRGLQQQSTWNYSYKRSAVQEFKVQECKEQVFKVQEM